MVSLQQFGGRSVRGARRAFLLALALLFSALCCCVSLAEEPTGRKAAEESSLEGDGVKNASKTAPISGRQAVGWAEPVLIEGVQLSAKLDSGSTVNELHAGNRKFFKRKGERWVRFTLSGSKGSDVSVERKILPAHGKKVASKKYPRVRMGFCLGRHYIEELFKLVDRTDRDQKVRLGREVLSGFYTIDPARTMVSIPSCPQVISSSNEKKDPEK